MSENEKDNDTTGRDLSFYENFSGSRKDWYNRATAAYLETRLRYPDDMVDEALQEASLRENSHILEIGCGPYPASVSLISRHSDHHYTITAMDPAPANCETARQQCQQWKDQVTILESNFEDYQPSSPETKIDAILCPTSFHWITPEVACRKTAQLLKETNGPLMLWWVWPPMPTNTSLWEELQDIYDSLDESKLGHEFRHYGTPEQTTKAIQTLTKRILESGLYEERGGQSKKENENENTLPSIQLRQTKYRYTPAKFVRLLSTLSPYIALPETKRKPLLEQVQKRLGEVCQKANEKDLDLISFAGYQTFWLKK